MKKLILLLVLTLCALTSPANALTYCTAPPLVNGYFDVDQGVIPTPDWITSFYRFSTQTYVMRMFAVGHSANVSFGSTSGVQIRTGSACTHSACAPFTGDKWYSVYLPGSRSAGYIDVIINGVKVAEWGHVWPKLGLSPPSVVDKEPVLFDWGVVGFGDNFYIDTPQSQLVIAGYHTGARGRPVLKYVTLDLENECGWTF